MKYTASPESKRLEQLKSLKEHLLQNILGQEHIIDRLTEALLRGEMGLLKTGRPKGSFLLLGPTGVGKTEVTQTFTRFLFGDKHLHRFDMSEYQTQGTLPALIDQICACADQTADSFSNTGSGTFLFDEIEKAHPFNLDVFLQVLDASRLTNSTGKTLDLSQFYVVFTSNLASSEMLDLEHSTFASLERIVLSRAQQHMRPELFARINEKLVFNKLSYDVQLRLAKLLLEREITYLAGLGYVLTFGFEVLNFLVRHGFHPRLGARPMRDAVERLIGNAVVEDLLEEGYGCGTLVVEGEFLRLR
jgi:ATP-dependent Clp protease ATP-binding subunit ClpB